MQNTSGTNFLSKVDANARELLKRFEKRYNVKAVWTISTDDVFCDGIFFIGPIEPIMKDFGIDIKDVTLDDIGKERKVTFKLGEVKASGYLGTIDNE